MSYAQIIFTQITNPNIYMWNTMIRGYCKADIPVTGFTLFRRMIQERVDMDCRSFVFGLKVCEQFKTVLEGEEIHCVISKTGFASELLVRNGLVHFYSTRGYLDEAQNLFDESSVRDVVSWTTLIGGYVQKNLPDDALKLFNSMLSCDVEPNEVTMIAVLSTCSRKGDISLARSIRIYIEKKNFNCGLNLLNAFIDVHVKCGCLKSAREIFDKMTIKDAFSWTSMINGYAKYGELHLARKFFDRMPEKNLVSWSAMIAGYSQNNLPNEALDLFHEMVAADILPIESTLVCVLSACTQLGFLDLGCWIHHYYVKEKRVQQSVILANALIDMYSKCGSIDSARDVFNGMPERDLVSWNSMIVGYAAHGHAKQALTHFVQMKSMGLKPDDITFVGILSACSHGGFVTQGWEYFKDMKRVFGLEQKLEHYACIIDLLGRIGLLREAYELIKEMPWEPDEAVWGALLNACRMHGNFELGNLAAEKLMYLDPKDSGIYMLLSGICASNRRWVDVRMVRSMMRERGVKKTPGRSLIEVEGEFHEFLVAEESHPQSKEIYKVLNELFVISNLERYVPNTSNI